MLAVLRAPFLGLLFVLGMVGRAGAADPNDTVVIEAQRPRPAVGVRFVTPESRAASLAYNTRRRFEARIPDGFVDGGREMRFDSDMATNPTRELIVIDRNADRILARHAEHARALGEQVRAGTLTELAAYEDLARYVDARMSPGGQRANAIAAEARITAEHANRPLLIGDTCDIGGVCRHRSIMYKVLADDLAAAAGTPSRVALVRGDYVQPGSVGRTFGQHAWNELALPTESRMVVDVMNPSSSGRFPTTAMVHERYADIDRSPMYSNRPEPAPASARVAAPAACEPRKAPPAPAPRTAAPRTAGLASRARALAPIAEPIGMNLGMAFAEDGAEWLFPQATSNRDLLAQVQRETMERAYQEREMARWAAGTGRRFGSYNELLDYLASARRAGYTIDGRNYRVSYIESVGFPADAAFTAPYNGPTPEDIAVREARRYATSTTSDRRNTPGPVGAHARALLDGNPIRSIAPPARTPEQVREAFLRATSETPEQRIVRERGNRFYDDHNARPGSCANCHR